MTSYRSIVVSHRRYEMFTDTKKISEAGAWVHLKVDGRRLAYWIDENTGEEDEGRPARVKMLGPDSATLQKRARERFLKRRKAFGGDFETSKMSDAEFKELVEISSTFMIENLVDATLTWENIPCEDGTLMVFSPENALWLYNSYPSIVRQLQAEAGKIGDFLALAAQN